MSVRQRASGVLVAMATSVSGCANQEVVKESIIKSTPKTVVDPETGCRYKPDPNNPGKEICIPSPSND